MQQRSADPYAAAGRRLESLINGVGCVALLLLIMHTLAHEFGTFAVACCCTFTQMHAFQNECMHSRGSCSDTPQKPLQLPDPSFPRTHLSNPTAPHTNQPPTTTNSYRDGEDELYYNMLMEEGPWQKLQVQAVLGGVCLTASTVICWLCDKDPAGNKEGRGVLLLLRAQPSSMMCWHRSRWQSLTACIRSRQRWCWLLVCRQDADKHTYTHTPVLVSCLCWHSPVVFPGL